jgi:phosphoglycerol transferase MdoB-like AlkP superfamily enzyme
MKTYLLSGGFNQLTGKDDFPSDAMNSKWGAHDGVVLSRQTAELDTVSEPFFSVLLTLSTHEPFEVPVTTPFNGAGEPELFKKAAWYTDLSLREYFTSIQSKKWFDNTIFVLVADHGHRLPLDRAYEDPKIRRIPLLIWSPLLADSLKGKTIEATGTQHDIPATLLQQLGIGHTQYYWSNDLLQTPRNNYAYQSLDESMIWITPGDTLVLPLDGKGQSDQDGNERDARAFLQTLYRQFISF